MVSVCFYFQVHQPYRVKKYTIFDIGNNSNYFYDDGDNKRNNEKILRKVSNKCYLPANAVLLELLNKYPEFKISFSFSGVFLEQLEEFAPDVLDSFKKLVDTGQVEILAETYYHSLAFLYSKGEFREQVKLHENLIKRLFGLTPKVFRNTELIYSNEVAREVEAMGYKGILSEGSDNILGWRSPNFLYRPTSTKKIKVLTKNYRLSDDLAFRFSEKSWKEWPLTAPKYVEWVNAINGNGEVLNLFMDYETFGEHQWEDTGIFNFMRALPGAIFKHPDFGFITPSEAGQRYTPVAKIDCPYFTSWADIERDLTAWIGNPLQNSAIEMAYQLESAVKKSGDINLIGIWRKLLTSDHFYYMCTKWFSDGDVHKYFNPYESPYDAYVVYMNILNDLMETLKQRGI